MALALDIRDRDLAVEVMEKFLDDLMATWPARRNDYEIDGWSGACLSNVRVMPELAPCYVATDDTLVIGWNAGSIRHALAGEEPSGPNRADRRGRAPPRQTPPGPGPPRGAKSASISRGCPRSTPSSRRSRARPPYRSRSIPWTRLDLRGHRGDDSYLFHAELVAP